MDKTHYRYIIVGAGLSGLTTAYKLWQSGETNFLIVESRDRIGGRIKTKNGVDFGATWFQEHHKDVAALLDQLNIESFPQYNKGKSVLVYSSMAPAHTFESDPNVPAARRVSGGTAALIEGLSVRFRESIKTATKVSKISLLNDQVFLETSNENYTAEKVVITIPPRLTTGLVFEPSLPKELYKAMEMTHTWMSNAIKVGMTFDRPFWREKGLSGMMIGQVGAVTELYDHSNATDDHYTLMGFVNEGLRELSPAHRKERILSYIEKYWGPEIRSYVTYREKDWYHDRNTSCERLQSVYISPQYGNPIFQKAYMSNRILFSGAETSQLHGGYMDGAIRSGLLAGVWLLKK